MDVDIGEVQAQVEAPSAEPSASSSPSSRGKGLTELAHDQELAERRAQRLRDRLRAD
ncbi:MAG: hypothetical protein AAF799_14770 [Myxococcota bacterium]